VAYPCIRVSHFRPGRDSAYEESTQTAKEDRAPFIEIGLARY